MIGRLKDLTIDRNGGQVLSLHINGDFSEAFDALKDEIVDVTVKKYRAKRSLDANAIMWHFCDEIAKVAGVTKEFVYRDEIRQVGVYTAIRLRDDAVEAFRGIWQSRGIGWIADIVDDSGDGEKLVFAYHGSSTYDTAQMSRLIDNIMQDAKALGIETMSESERSLMIDAWTSCG